MRLTSTSNPLVKLTRSLHTRAARKETGLCLLEGETLVREALSSGLKLRYIFATEIIEDLQIGSETVFHQVTEDLLGYMSTTSSYPAILAIAEPAIVTAPLQSHLAIYLEAIQDPGNLGAIIRTALAAGVDTIFLSEASVDVYNPKVLRASMGAVFRAYVQHRSLAELQYQRVLGTSSHQLNSRVQNYQDLHLSSDESVLLLLGNEGQGLSSEALSLATDLIQIPMDNGFESLNVLAAASVILFSLRDFIRGATR